MTIILLVLIAAVSIANVVMQRYKDNYPKLNRIIVAADVALPILTLIVAIISLPIDEPSILPVDGMLTEEYPCVSFENITRGELYYSYDTHTQPCDSGTKYTVPFEPDKEGSIAYQIKFLWNRSKVWYQYMTPAAVSRDRYGEQSGVLSDKSSNLPDVNEGTETSKISQSYMESEDNPPNNITWGWGDTENGREDYTVDDINHGLLGDKITFDSITDSVIGDERNFVAARIDDGNHGKDNVWSANRIEVAPGNDYIIRLYVHNNSPKGYDGAAHNVKAQFMIPEESGRTIVAHGMICSDNAVPDRYWDSVVFTCQDKFHLEYIPDSALIESNGSVGGTTLSDTIVNNWVTMGYNALDGDIPGCYQYAFYLSIKVRVVAD